MQKSTNDGIDFDRLETLISQASPGPWEAREADGLVAILTAAGWIDDQSSEQDMKNARFVAGFNPVVAQQLVSLARRSAVLEQSNESYELRVFESWLASFTIGEEITRLERDQMLDAWEARAEAIDLYDDERAAFEAWFAADQERDGCRGTSPPERLQMLSAWLARAAVTRSERLAPRR